MPLDIGIYAEVAPPGSLAAARLFSTIWLMGKIMANSKCGCFNAIVHS